MVCPGLPQLRVTISSRAGGAFQAYGSIQQTFGPFPYPFAFVRPSTADRSVATREFYVRESGEHFLSIGDLRNTEGGSPAVGGPTLTYRVEIVSVSTMPTIVTPPLVNRPGSIPDTGDVTAFLFTATLGDSLAASTRAMQISPPSKVDTALLLFYVLASPPTLVAFNDDLSSAQVDSTIQAIAPRTGPYLLVVDHYDVGGLTAADRKWEVSLAGATPTTTTTTPATTTT